MAGDRSPRLDIRADQALLARLDSLAAALCEPGVNVKRSGAARAALLRGLAVLEQERGLAPKEKEKPAASRPRGPGILDNGIAKSSDFSPHSPG
jgi:hypothetical protein